MDRILQEERKKLDEIETIIDTEVRKSSQKVERLNKEISNYYPVDYEDICI